MKPDHSDYDISTRVLNSMDGEGLVNLHDKLHRTPYHMLKNRKVTRSEIQGRILKKARNYSEIYNKIHEDAAPTNSVGGGSIEGIGVGPKGEPGVTPAAMSKYKRNNIKNAPKPRKTLSMFMKGI